MATAKKTAKKAAAKATKATKAARATPATKAAGAGPQEAFAALKGILQKYEGDLVLVHDRVDNYYLDTRSKTPRGQPLFFGAVRAGKSYTSFYLMPVYVNPELLEGMSPALKKRMQGKSCFNFKAPDPALFEEIAALTERGFAHWKAGGRI